MTLFETKLKSVLNCFIFENPMSVGAAVDHHLENGVTLDSYNEILGNIRQTCSDYLQPLIKHLMDWGHIPDIFGRVHALNDLLRDENWLINHASDFNSKSHQLELQMNRMYDWINQLAKNPTILPNEFDNTFQKVIAFVHNEFDLVREYLVGTK